MGKKLIGPILTCKHRFVNLLPLFVLVGKEIDRSWFQLSTTGTTEVKPNISIDGFHGDKDVRLTWLDGRSTKIKS
jgi:hypothetical protein